MPALCGNFWFDAEAFCALAEVFGPSSILRFATKGRALISWTPTKYYGNVGDHFDIKISELQNDDENKRAEARAIFGMDLELAVVAAGAMFTAKALMLKFHHAIYAGSKKKLVYYAARRSFERCDKEAISFLCDWFDFVLDDDVLDVYCICPVDENDFRSHVMRRVTVSDKFYIRTMERACYVGDESVFYAYEGQHVVSRWYDRTGIGGYYANTLQDRETKLRTLTRYACIGGSARILKHLTEKWPEYLHMHSGRGFLDCSAPSSILNDLCRGRDLGGRTNDIDLVPFTRAAEAWKPALIRPSSEAQISSAIDHCWRRRDVDKLGVILRVCDFTAEGARIACKRFDGLAPSQAESSIDHAYEENTDKIMSQWLREKYPVAEEGEPASKRRRADHTRDGVQK